jgi:hypothetical protein
MGPPPAGAYGNPYAPGALPVGAPGAEEGSLGIGIALGFIFGCFGLIGCLIWGKPQTKKGAGIGFGISFVLGIILQVAMR